MSDIDWIGNREDPQAAAGFVDSRADDSEGIMVVVLNKDSSFSFRAFGNFTMGDAMAAGSLLNYQGAKQMYENED